jgi:hypothetical protein
MLVMVDGGQLREVLNDVKVIIGDGTELHITITLEGVITDVVQGGSIVETRCVEHDWPEEA